MATNKAKRSIHLAQPTRPSSNPEPAAELMPVRAHVYRTIAELNLGFEKTLQELKVLQRISIFRSERLTAMHDLVCGIRAQANREFLGVLSQREMANADHFEGIRHSTPKPPSN
jgi:hypothetical protein